MRGWKLLGLAVACTITATPCAAWAQAQSRSISFAKIGASIAAGTPWAQIQFDDFPLPCRRDRVLTWDGRSNEAFQDREFERVFREEAAKAGLKVSGDPNNLFEQDQKSAELQIGALVTRIDAVFCGRKSFKDALFENERMTVSGSVAMDIEWQIYSTLEGRVVGRVPTSGRYQTKAGLDGGTGLLMRMAFGDAARAFAADPTLRNLVTAGSPSAAAPSLQGIPFTQAAPVRKRPGEASASVVTIFAGEAMGSGFLISPEGYLLTNRHVVGDAQRVRIRWADKSEGVGEVIRSDRRRDIALIKIDASGRKALGLRPGSIQPGETVFAIGTPLEKDFQNTVTRGVVSGSRVLEGLSFLQSDVVVNSGNSGGPLIDESGAVVGVTVSGIDINGAPVGINLFIPIDDALKALALTPAT